MKLTKSLSMLALAGLMSAAAWIGMSTSASAGAGSNLLTVVSSKNIQEVLTPSAGAKYHNVFVEVCPAALQECKDEVSKLGMSAALAAGGWLGMDLYRDNLKFYVLDPTPANLAALDAACKSAATNAPGAALCKIDAAKFPQLVMFRTDGSKSSVQVGPSESTNFSSELQRFVRSK